MRIELSGAVQFFDKNFVHRTISNLCLFKIFRLGQDYFRTITCMFVESQLKLQFLTAFAGAK